MSLKTITSEDKIKLINSRIRLKTFLSFSRTCKSNFSSTISGDAIEMIGDAIEMIGDAIEMIGGAIEMIGDAIEMIGDAIEMIGDAIEMIGDSVPEKFGNDIMNFKFLD